MPTYSYTTGGWVPYGTSATYTVLDGWRVSNITASNEPDSLSWNPKDWQAIENFIAFYNKQKSDPEEQDIVDLLD